MVDAARRALASSDAVVESSQITYVHSPAESLAFLADGSVDLMIAGMCIGLLRLFVVVIGVYCLCIAQAGHWFDWSRMWPEAARVLRKDGTAAIWVRDFFVFLHPGAFCARPDAI